MAAIKPAVQKFLKPGFRCSEIAIALLSNGQHRIQGGISSTVISNTIWAKRDGN
jgi:hypothetical protein